MHAYDAASKQSDKSVIRTLDTDVVVLVVANVSKLGVSELWVLFANKLESGKATALLFFHALGVILCLVLKEKAEKLHGQFGVCLMMSLKTSLFCQIALNIFHSTVKTNWRGCCPPI